MQVLVPGGKDHLLLALAFNLFIIWLKLSFYRYANYPPRQGVTHARAERESGKLMLLDKFLKIVFCMF
jgi:hypothetical protein